MKRVLQIVNYYYPHLGGIEQVARDIADSIKSLNDEKEYYEQKIICFNEDADDGKKKCKRAETAADTVNGIDVIRCGCITKKASQSISLSFGKKLKEIMRTFNPEIVIFHYPNPFEAVYLNRYLNDDFKLILYWHLDITKQKILGKIFHRQTMRLLERADHVIATSPVYIDGSPYLSQYRGKCKVIPNCIDEKRLAVTEEIKKEADNIRNQNRDKIICFGIGRHIPYKGFKYLVEASKYLDDRFRIFIGGKGELTEELKAQARNDEKISFLGRISDTDLIAYYLAMDIFCFPSITKNEAFGIALAEGMYFGKPAVTFTIYGSGVNYVNINNETGLEVPNADCRAYADALRKLADDKSMREQLGKKAKQRIEHLMLKKHFAENIQNLLEQL